MIDRGGVPGRGGDLHDLESGARLQHLVPETRRLHDQIPGAERERRPLLLVDQLCLAAEAVDELEPDRVMVDTIVDRPAPCRADVAGDPAAAETRGQEVTVEQTGAPLVNRGVGEAGVDEGGRWWGEVPGFRCHLDHEATRPGVPPGQDVAAGGHDELGCPAVGAVELEAEPVPGHHGLGRIVGGSDLLEAEAVALEELDGRLQRIGGDANRRAPISSVRAQGGASSSTTSDMGMSPVRSRPSRSAFIGSGPWRDIFAMSSSVIALPTTYVVP